MILKSAPSLFSRRLSSSCQVNNRNKPSSSTIGSLLIGQQRQTNHRRDFLAKTMTLSTLSSQKSWPKVTLYGDLTMRPFRNIWMLEEIGLPYKHVMCKPWSKIAKSVHPLGKVPALSVEYHVNEGIAKEKEGEETQEFVVVESAAINTFLGDAFRNHTTTVADNSDDIQPHRQSALVPPPSMPQLRAKYDSLILFVMTEIDSQSLWIHRKHSNLSNVFGEAPGAVMEARRQFDNALDAMIHEITIAGEEDENNPSLKDGDGDGGGCCHYLLPTGFSAVDILFVHCCSWAQQIGWLEGNNGTSIHTSTMGNSDENAPKPLTPKLEAYLKQCRSRPAFMRATGLRKNQVDEKKKRPINSKL
mmetsp:Transcript_10535/g.16034  ORF Transcript_10535/g.16034 Transcript_10535/m.16034 type:complete len:359 (+) Transcript_10535:52-1128(+)